MKTTKQNLKTFIDEKIGTSGDFLTPQQAIAYLEEHFLVNEEVDSNDLDLFAICGNKAMNVFNHIFNSDVVLSDDEIKKYELSNNDITIEYLFDGDVDFEWTDDISFFEQENIPYIACLNKDYTDFKAFLNTLSLVCKDTTDTIKLDCFTTRVNGEYQKSGFFIDTHGDISFYGPKFVIDCRVRETILNHLYIFLKTFNCKTFEDIESLNIPIKFVCDESDEEFEQFFEAAGFEIKK